MNDNILDEMAEAPEPIKPKIGKIKSNPDWLYTLVLIVTAVVAMQFMFTAFLKVKHDQEIKEIHLLLDDKISKSDADALSSRAEERTGDQFQVIEKPVTRTPIKQVEPMVMENPVSNPARLTVHKEHSNIRSGPDSSYSIRATLDPGSKVNAIGKQGKWVEIEWPGNGKGFMHECIFDPIKSC